MIAKKINLSTIFFMEKQFFMVLKTQEGVVGAWSRKAQLLYFFGNIDWRDNEVY